MNRLVLLFAAAALALLPCAAQAQHTVTVYQPAGELVGHTKRINNFAFHPNGKLLATTGYDGTVRLWDVQSRKEARRYSTLTWEWEENPAPSASTDPYSTETFAVAFSPDGKLLAISVGTGEFGMFPNIVLTGEVMEDGVAKQVNHAIYNDSSARDEEWGDIYDKLSFTPDGSYLMAGKIATANPQGQVMLWRVQDIAKQPESASYLRQKALIIHKSSPAHEAVYPGYSLLRQATLSPDGKLVLAKLSYDNVIVLTEVDLPTWNITRQDSVRVFSGGITVFVISPDNKFAAIGDYFGGVGLLNLKTKEISVVVNNRMMVLAEDYDGQGGLDITFAPQVSALAFSPDGKFLAVGGYYGDLTLWHLESRQETAELHGYVTPFLDGDYTHPIPSVSNAVENVAFSPDGKFLAATIGPSIVNGKLSGDSDDNGKTVRLWKVQVTAVEEENTAIIPQGFALRQNYPNPFNPETVISYELPRAADVRLAVYDLSGRQIRALVQSRKSAGYYKTSWDGRDEQGQEVASGVYFYRLTTGTFTATKKMVVMK